MFGILKQKITGFIDGLTKKGEKPPEPEAAAEEKIPQEEEAPLKPEEPLEKDAVAEKPVEKKPPAEKKTYPEKEAAGPAPAKDGKKTGKKEGRAPEPEKAKKPEKKIIEEKPRIEIAHERKPEPKEVPEPKPAPEKPEEKEPETQEEEKLPIEETREPPQEAKEPERTETTGPEKPKPRIKLGALSAIKSFVTSEVEIKEGDVRGMLDNLELELLEGDVEMSVAGSIKEELAGRLVGQTVKKKELHDFIRDSIRDTLAGIMESEKKVDLLSVMEGSEKPVRVIFLGVNGSGKTTTIAKFTNMLQSKGYRVVLAAADTFRAAAIEQMAVHAERLGAKMIKRDYGADPTSVAYDAVNYAKAHSIDAVFIDTAGRQDTNVSLINELKKMNRVIQPNLKIYVGESIAGNAILEQVGVFHREIGLDGVVLTKLDCDPKGGTMLSISRLTGIPIIYIGTGQAYGDLEPFDAKKMAGRIVE